jgi:hypothetical protein
MPADFIEVCRTLSVHQLVDHYRTRPKAVMRWYREAGIEPNFIKPGRPRHQIPPPDDLAEVCRTTHRSGLMRHYQLSQKVIDRWLKLTGLRPAGYVKTVSKSQPGQGMVIRNSYGNLSQTRVSSIYDDAADVLRRERFKVNRCNDVGIYAQTGEYWRVGWTVLTGDELLARADRYRSRAA